MVLSCVVFLTGLYPCALLALWARSPTILPRAFPEHQGPYISPPWLPDDPAWYGRDWAHVLPHGYYINGDIDAVFKHFDEDKKSTVKKAFACGLAATQLEHGDCGEGVNYFIVGAWQILDLWDRRDLILLLSSENANGPSLLLAHIPLRFGPGWQASIADHAVSTLRIPSTPIAILVPFACDLLALDKFLVRLISVIVKVPGRMRVLIAWAEECPGTANVITESSIKDIVIRHVMKLRPTIALDILALPISFSRGRLLHETYKYLTEEEIGVVLDVDMVVDQSFFDHSRAFTSPGSSVYFPIVFSRYNPEIIANHASFLSKAKPELADRIRGAEKALDILSETGVWRQYGFGMLAAFKSDIFSAGGYDIDNRDWGMEDVDLYSRLNRNASTKGLTLWRAYDPSIQHIFHAKSCAWAYGKERETMCIGSKIGVEGTKQQIGIALLQARGEMPLTFGK